MIQHRNELNNGRYFKVSVWAMGVRKHCRKVARHNFDLGYIEYTDILTDERKDNIIAASKATLAATMKEITDKNYTAIHLDDVKVSNDNGFDSLTWLPFSETNQRFKI